MRLDSTSSSKHLPHDIISFKMATITLPEAWEATQAFEIGRTADVAEAKAFFPVTDFKTKAVLCLSHVLLAGFWI